MRLAIEIVKAQGHRNVRGLHRTTMEITKDTYLTEKGDCIIGIKANKALADFNKEFKSIAQSPFSIIVLVIIVNELYDIVVGQGSPMLSYSDERRIILRKSSYTDGATAAIRSNKGARDIDRRIIEMLRGGGKLIALFIALDLNSIYPIDKLIGSIIKNLGKTRYTPTTLC